MLTSQAREILTGVEAVIVDEIHAVAQSKRGAHLALTLERLSKLVRDEGGDDPQRIGLSATQRPLERIAAVPRRAEAASARSSNAGVRKELDLEIVVPVEDMADPGGSATAAPGSQADPASPADPARTAEGASGLEASPDRIDPGPIEGALDPAVNSRSIWPAIYPRAARSWSASTPRRSSSSTTAAAPSGSPSGSTSSTTRSPSRSSPPPSRRATRRAARLRGLTLPGRERRRSPGPTTARSPTRSGS